MQIGNTFIGVYHRQIRIIGINRCDFGFYFSARGFVQFVEIAQQIAETVVNIDAGSGQLLAIFFKYRGKENFHCMAEDDGIGYLHHGGFHVQREQYAFGFGIGYLFL